MLDEAMRRRTRSIPTPPPQTHKGTKAYEHEAKITIWRLQVVDLLDRIADRLDRIEHQVPFYVRCIEAAGSGMVRAAEIILEDRVKMLITLAFVVALAAIATNTVMSTAYFSIGGISGGLQGITP